MTDTVRPEARLELASPMPAESGADLPCPTTQRWQPLRLGLVDLFHYDDEQFWFHDGRLLLRGNNGTGKSKVLALTLPFLLDGSAHPRRVEPDADPKKRMEWNLLLGGAHPSTERTGYSWVEFGRVDPDGTEHFATLAIGLKAAAGRGIVKTWYVVTARRVGDLRLVDDNRIALTQERLRDELAATRSGQVYPTQEAYRRAVDERLFRLGEERYAALIDLLIQLRQPQLSKNPNEKALSGALTEALTPLDQAVIADVAESFRSLEEERSGIADARETLRAAEDFLKHYRAYAGVAARRRTSAVREANSAYERAGRNLRGAEADLEAVIAEIEDNVAAQTAAEDRRSALEGRERALRSSPEMRHAEQLDRSHIEASEAEGRVVVAEREAAQFRERAERDAAAEHEAVRGVESATTQAEGFHIEARHLSEPAGLAPDHDAVVADAETARRALTRRREQIRHVRGLVDAMRQTAERAEHDRVAVDDAEADATSRAEIYAAAEAAVEEKATVHGEAVRAYLAELHILDVGSATEDLVEQVRIWARSQMGDSPGQAAVDRAATAAQDRIARERAAAEVAVRGVEQELADLRAEIVELEKGRDPEPPPAPGRTPGNRELLAGAPLWRLTDFADGVRDTERAGVEAALQSAGLLDAWVFPDGTLHSDGDVVLGPHGSVVMESGESLARILVPVVGPDDVVPAEAVAGVLRRLGLGERSGAALWVDHDGRWGAGPARGSWHKDRAEYVGAGARETTRRSRIAALQVQVTEGEARRLVGQRRIADADKLAAQVRDEARDYPRATERGIVTAHADAASARREVQRAEASVVQAHERWDTARERAQQAADELAEQAAELQLGTTRAALDETTDAVASYELALVKLRNATVTLEAATAALDQATERSAETAAMLTDREAAVRSLRTEATGLRARFDALSATVGATVAQLQKQLGEVATELEHVATMIRKSEQQQLELAARRGTLVQKVTDLEQRRAETSTDRERQVQVLRTFAATGLLRVSLPALEVPSPSVGEEWTVTAALALSRTAELLLGEVDESDESWARAQQRASSASTELTSQMSRHGHTAFVEQYDDVIVARVRYLNDEIDVDRLAGRLADEIADRERLLSAREREILENHLVNEVAGHLHELLGAAEDQIDRMNRELAERKTSTGMQLRVRWRERADAPAGLAVTRQLMLRSDATWTAADRAAIGDFLQTRIAEARQADPTAGWQEHLEQALDYRQWHTFTVERWQNGQWRSASGPASGGEKVLAVSVPLFAAAAAHYNSAGPLAPRLILLDEAFAGVDDDSRAKSLGLLATFDLDVVMTSEREWGCYPQVPGLSIAQLSRVEGIAAVGVTRWQWDGHRRTRVDDVDESARATAGGSTEPTDATLFGEVPDGRP